MKQVSMRFIFIRYLMVTGISVLLLLLGALFWMKLLQNMGILYFASAGAQNSARALAEVREMSLETFEEEKLHQLCRYVIFTDDGAGAQPVRTNMDERHLNAARKAQKGEGKGGWPGYRQYYMTAELTDGSVCWLQYDYAVHYRDPELDERLPDFQWVWFILVLMLMLAVIWGITRRYVRLFARDTALLTQAGARILGQDLSESRRERAKIREFEQALTTLDGVKKELEESLSGQWRMRQERNDSIAALTHDLKTPLAVIGGNAELLGEEQLTGEQSLCVDMILHNVEHAKEYLDRLRQLCVSEKEPAEAMRQIQLSHFYGECCRAGEALCRAKQICFAAQKAPDESFAGYPEDLLRALTNILENAARYTPAKGRISFRVYREEENLIFLVEDSGPGFSKEALKKAGNMLYTSDDSRPQDGHWGMGLYFAARTAQKHQGMLTVSNAQQGRFGQVKLVIAA